ncbi:MAG TPA: hypothetical protein VKQ72_00930 [Aggregatilineales bacterium]|nr:hypothetical protein [Aggregatilineales bacterium]
MTPLKDATQRHELESYTLERLASGLFRYTAPSSQHDDTIMATALGFRAMHYIGAHIRFV